MIYKGGVMPLATLQTISAITKAENSDNLEIAKVMGWHVVVKKGEFKVGDRCVYVEIDSVMPVKPEYEFLAPRRYRVRTVKLRGNLSQGLCLPLDVVPKDITLTDEGQDLTDHLGIVKYEKPSVARGQAEGGFPTHTIPKTDEPMIQSYKQFLKSMLVRGDEYYISTKMDGSSGTFYKFNDHIGVCSRNLELKTDSALPGYHEDRWLRVYEKYNIREKLLKYNKNIALQGEVYGPGIQSNNAGSPDVRLQLFNVWDIDNMRYLDFDEFIAVAKELDIPTVQILFEGKYPEFKADISSPTYYEESEKATDSEMDRLIALAETLKYPNGHAAEGMVIRPKKNYDIKGYRVSFKVLNNKYLLSEKD